MRAAVAQFEHVDTGIESTPISVKPRTMYIQILKMKDTDGRRLSWSSVPWSKISWKQSENKIQRIR